MNLGPPALEANTLPLGYRGGGVWDINGMALVIYYMIIIIHALCARLF